MIQTTYKIGTIRGTDVFLDGGNDVQRAWLQSAPNWRAIEDILPNWIQRLTFLIDANGFNDGALAVTKSAFAYRTGTITLCPGFWEVREELRFNALVHELFHVATDPLALAAEEIRKTFAPDAPFVESAFDMAVEQTVQDLALAYIRARGVYLAANGTGDASEP